MAAAVPVAHGAPPPLTTTVACSNEVVESWGRKVGLPDGLNPDAIRAWRNGDGWTVWHKVAFDRGCGIDVCEWIKSRGLLDMINLRNDDGVVPLHFAVQMNEAKARWMMANGADVNAVTNQNTTIFSLACMWRSLSFLQELASKVPPDHLSMSSRNGWSPMQKAFQHNPDYLPIVRMLILRGATVRPDDFPASYYGGSLLDRRRDLLASLEADLRLNDLILIGLVLGCGVHAPTTITATFTTTTTTATTKRVRTQRPDGGWSAPVSVPCEPRLVVTAAPTNERAAERVENHLPKLRGFRNSEVRMAIAGFMGVRPALELGRLRAARDVVWRPKAVREGMVEKAGVFEVALPAAAAAAASAASGEGGSSSAASGAKKDELAGVGLSFYSQIYVLKVPTVHGCP